MGRGLHQRGNIWWISYQDSDGKQRRESSRSTNRRVAQKLLDLRRGELVEARLGLPRSQTPLLSDFAKEFLNTVPHVRTRDRYQDSVNALLEFFGEKRLADVSAELIYRFQRHRIAQGRKAATINRDVSTLSGILRKAKKLHFVMRNPCEDVDQLNETHERREGQPLTYEEEARLLLCCGPLLRMFIILLIDTGVRPRREALPLRW